MNCSGCRWCEVLPKFYLIFVVYICFLVYCLFSYSFHVVHRFVYDFLNTSVFAYGFSAYWVSCKLNITSTTSTHLTSRLFPSFSFFRFRSRKFKVYRYQWVWEWAICFIYWIWQRCAARCSCPTYRVLSLIINQLDPNSSAKLMKFNCPACVVRVLRSL